MFGNASRSDMLGKVTEKWKNRFGWGLAELISSEVPVAETVNNLELPDRS